MYHCDGGWSAEREGRDHTVWHLERVEAVEAAWKLEPSLAVVAGWLGLAEGASWDDIEKACKREGATDELVGVRRQLVAVAPWGAEWPRGEP